MYALENASGSSSRLAGYCHSKTYPIVQIRNFLITVPTGGFTIQVAELWNPRISQSCSESTVFPLRNLPPTVKPVFPFQPSQRPQVWLYLVRRKLCANLLFHTPQLDSPHGIEFSSHKLTPTGYLEDNISRYPELRGYTFLNFSLCLLNKLPSG